MVRADRRTPGLVPLLSVFGAAVLGALVFFGGGWAWDWWQRGRHVSKVSVTARVDAIQCPDPASPVFIQVTNASTLSLTRWDLDLVARRPGRSTDLTAPNRFKGDHIVAPGTDLVMCGNENLTGEARGADPRELEWTAHLLSMEFSAD